MLYNTTFHWFINVLKNRKNLTSFLSEKKPCRFDVYTAIKMLIIHTGNTKLWRANWSKTKRINTRTIVSLLLLSLKITRIETDCHGNEIGDRYEVRFQNGSSLPLRLTVKWRPIWSEVSKWFIVAFAFNCEMAKGCRTTDPTVNVIIVFFLSYADFCLKGL